MFKRKRVDEICMHRVTAELEWGMGELKSANGEVEDLKWREGEDLKRSQRGVRKGGLGEV